MVSPKTMKNWLPLVFGPLLAIATTPAGYAGRRSVGTYSLSNWYFGPPEPVPVGSPHWSTWKSDGWPLCGSAPDLFTNRWHEIPLKKFLPARYVKLAAVHGAFLRSSWTTIFP